jgi:hypothetical protein
MVYDAYQQREHDSSASYHMLIFYKNAHNCLYTKFYFLVSYKKKGVISEMCCVSSSFLYVAGSVPNRLFKSTVLHIGKYNSLSYRKVRYTPNIRANLIVCKPASYKLEA